MPLVDLVRRLHPAACGLPHRVDRVAAQTPVIAECLHVEVDGAVVGDVRVALVDERLDQLDHLGDAPGRPGHKLRAVVVLDGHHEPQPPGVGEEGLRVELGDRVGIAGVDVAGVGGKHSGLLGLQQPPAGHLHAVLAPAVRIVLGHVADVGQVHDVDDLVAEQLQRAAQQVGVEERPEVPDVGEVVDGGPAGVEGDPLARGVERQDRLEAPGERVIEVQRHGSKPYGRGVRVATDPTRAPGA